MFTEGGEGGREGGNEGHFSHRVSSAEDVCLKFT